MIRWARIEPQNYPERTGFRLRTERHWCGLKRADWRIRDSPRRLDRHCGASVVTARDAVANRTENPDEITDTQLVLLSAASQREDGVIDLGAKGNASSTVIGKLLSEQLVEETAAPGGLPV